ncbi:hypothetical protein K4L44_06620 [Halosquirtibacter laminarini]|uniref:Uncharacterized protein n=1 Tax=Halosquirtibacter laminarini TaxID=3374600 RepID=A0AC61NPJ4_9BACT|nr:hypothetical protein K4L44_06620 [Prolixibacteraceae bacterium]
MFENYWNRIIDWFYDKKDRRKLIREFNTAARHSFIQGMAPSLLKADISKGDASYRHQFSHWSKTGFRIVAFSGRQLQRNEMEQIGSVILSNDNLMRQLVVLGWDTLEIHGDEGQYGLRWQLKDYLALN